MESGKLAPPTLQVNTRQRAASNADLITSSSADPFAVPSPPLSYYSPINGPVEVYDPETALRSDPGTELDFQCDNNPFAFSPGQLNKLFNPKSLTAFQALGGLQGIANGLAQDSRRTGLSVDELDPAQATRGVQRVYEIPGFIGNNQTNALGDTAGRYNFMRVSYAENWALPIQRSSSIPIKVSQTRVIKTVGIVEAPFKFKGETETHKLVFHLLPESLHDVILGYKFLKATRTMSDKLLKASRVIVRYVRELATRRLFYLGGSAPKFTGLLNGRPREVLADSGAQSLFMNESFARNKGFLIDNSPRNRLTVQFADGSAASTTGMTYGVKWEYGLGGMCKEHTLDFHILPDAPADVILSDDFLYDTEAFAEYDCYLIDEDEDGDDAEDEGYLFAIKLLRKQVQQGTIINAIDNANIQEARRLAKEDQRYDDETREQFIADSSRHLLSLSQTVSPNPSSALSSTAAVSALPPSAAPPLLGSHGLGGLNLANTSSGGTSSAAGTSPTGSASPSGSGSMSPIGTTSPPAAHPPTLPVTSSGPSPQSWRAKLAGKLKRTKASGAT